METTLPITAKACIPVIPCANLERSLRFWVEGVGLNVNREMRRDGTLIGCMVYNEYTCFWLNESEGTVVKPENYEGIKLYWTPTDIYEARNRLLQLGYEVSEVEDRDYGQSEFFVTDDDGHSHCFGVATDSIIRSI